MAVKLEERVFEPQVKQAVEFNKATLSLLLATFTVLVILAVQFVAQ